LVDLTHQALIEFTLASFNDSPFELDPSNAAIVAQAIAQYLQQQIDPEEAIALALIEGLLHLLQRYFPNSSHYPPP
jgi:hypothetical protein